MSSINLLIKQLLSYGLAFAVTLFFLWGLRPIAIRLGLVDNPGGRKQHRGQVPLIGGIAMFLGFAFAILSLDVSLASYRGFLAAALLLVIVGILDDLHELSPRARLWAQLIASLMMIFWSGVSIHSIGNVFGIGDISLGYLTIPFTVFAMVAAINALNMIDGMDGLAGGVCFIELIVLAVLLHYSHQLADIQIIYTLIAVVFAFLLCNFPIRVVNLSSVFMGDSGSMFLGFVITWFLIKFSQGAHPSFPPVVILWVLAVPVFDIITVTFRRLLSRRSPTQASRDHIHHVLSDVGLTPTACTIAICTLSAIFGALGLLGAIYVVAQYLLFFLLLVSYVIYAVVYTIIRRRVSVRGVSVEKQSYYHDA